MGKKTRDSGPIKRFEAVNTDAKVPGKGFADKKRTRRDLQELAGEPAGARKTQSTYLEKKNKDLHEQHMNSLLQQQQLSIQNQKDSHKQMRTKNLQNKKRFLNAIRKQENEKLLLKKRQQAKLEVSC